MLFNPLPNDKISDWSKFKECADDEINISEKIEICFRRVENIVGKGENAGYPHFLHFLQCFQKDSYTGVLKVVIVW